MVDHPQDLEGYLEQQGRRKAREPSAWLVQAESLHAAGGAVWDESQRLAEELHAVPRWDYNRSAELLSNPRMWTWFVAMMLWAFALENVLKGLIIAADEDAIRVDGLDVRFPWSGKRGHDLVWLAERADIELDEGLKALLQRLSATARWGGRYPLPRDLRELMSETREGGERGGPNYMTGEDQKALQGLYHELFARLSTVSKEINEQTRLAQEAQRHARRPELLAELRARCDSHINDDGVTIFSSQHEPPTDERGVVACARCHTTVNLGRETVGALCLCGSLHVATYRYDPAYDRQTIHTETYPPTP